MYKRQGYAYREVDVDVHKGELVAVRGRNGSGKTALLLTLAGRMKQTEGTLNVGEFELPRQRSKAADSPAPPIRALARAQYSAFNSIPI